jgi:hypothetical protein
LASINNGIELPILEQKGMKKVAGLLLSAISTFLALLAAPNKEALNVDAVKVDVDGL